MSSYSSLHPLSQRERNPVNPARHSYNLYTH